MGLSARRRAGLTTTKRSGYRCSHLVVFAMVLGAAPLTRAYRGTIPIFPDIAAEKKKAAEAAAKVRCTQRQEVFAPPVVIKATSLTKVSNKPKFFFDKTPVKTLDGTTVEIHGPDSVALVGEAGSGKTTFLKCLAGLEKPTAGDITVSGLRKAVYVGRGINSTTGRTVRCLLRTQIASCMPGNDRRSIELATNDILGAMDLHGCSRTKDRDLSGGEVYRFAIAMALAKGCSSPTPPVLLLDGIFENSDMRVRRGVQFSLYSLQREMGVMLVFTSHDFRTVMELGKQVVEISYGKITEVSDVRKSSYIRRSFERLLMANEEKAIAFKRQNDRKKKGSTLS